MTYSVAAIADGLMSNVAPDVHLGADVSRHAGLLHCGDKAMSRVVAVVVEDETVPAKVVVGAGGAVNTMALWEVCILISARPLDSHGTSEYNKLTLNAAVARADAVGADGHRGSRRSGGVPHCKEVVRAGHDARGRDLGCREDLLIVAERILDNLDLSFVLFLVKLNRRGPLVRQLLGNAVDETAVAG